MIIIIGIWLLGSLSEDSLTGKTLIVNMNINDKWYSNNSTTFVCHMVMELCEGTQNMGGS